MYWVTTKLTIISGLFFSAGLATGSTLELSEAEVVTRIKNAHPSIVREQLEANIKQQAVPAALAAFDVTAYGTAQFSDDDYKKPLTAFTTSRRLDQQVVSAEIGFKKKFTTGTEVTMSVDGTNMRSTDVEQYSGGQMDTEVNAVIGLSFRQPLLRGMSARSEQAAVDEAEATVQAAEHQVESKILRTVAEGLRSFWELYRADAQIKLHTDARDNARTILSRAKLLAAEGKLSAVDIIDAEALVLERQSRLVSSRAQREVVHHELRLMLDEQDEDIQIKIADLPSRTAPPLVHDLDAYAQGILQNWPGYLRAQAQLKAEDARIIRAEDALLPKLDLIAGVNKRGSESSIRAGVKDTVTSSDRSIYVGLTLEMPLQGNRQADAVRQAAELRKQQAELDMRQIARRLTTDLKQRLAEAQQAYDQWQLARDNLTLSQSRYEKYYQSFQAGRTSVVELSDIEASLMRARENVEDKHVSYQLTLVSLRLVDGTLLGNS
ncbi:MAG: TolC family protein [Alphaproteobacteria bacterium]|nr:TolC family protein [Alphaproteobacteria bacterium]